MVAVVSARHHAGLAAADVGIGVHRPGQRPPWGADLLTSRGLLDAWLVLNAVPTARKVARRSASCAAYGSGAAGLLALAGPRRGATSRAGMAVNGAAAVSMAAGSWAAKRLTRTPAPAGEDASEWHALPGDEVLTRVESRTGGLTDAEAGERTADRTPEVTEGEAAGVLRATLEELANPLTPALATGAGLSAGLGSITDAGLISGVMGLNAVVGGLQRVGADRAVRRLMETGAAHVHVRRSGVEVMLEADRLVVGDVVVLRAGDAVPADCRILDAEGVEVDESSLTGESQTVTKTSQPSAARALADRHSMLYAGTAVAAGEATGVVVAVGDATEVGRSARAGTGQRRRSGVERRLSHLTAQTVPAALGAGAGLMGAALLHGRPFSSTLGTGVGLAVAAVPEGLPLVATVAQLASARRLSGRAALVRQPSTIEALGRVDVLCADKTGTLTDRPYQPAARLRRDERRGGRAPRGLGSAHPGGRTAGDATGHLGRPRRPRHRRGRARGGTQRDGEPPARRGRLADGDPAAVRAGPWLPRRARKRRRPAPAVGQGLPGGGASAMPPSRPERHVRPVRRRGPEGRPGGGRPAGPAGVSGPRRGRAPGLERRGPGRPAHRPARAARTPGARRPGAPVRRRGRGRPPGGGRRRRHDHRRPPVHGGVDRGRARTARQRWRDPHRPRAGPP